MSDALRPYAPQFRDDQADAIAAAIGETDPEVHALVALAHASVLISVIQTITDRIGAAVLSRAELALTARKFREDTDITPTDASENYRATKARIAKTIGQSRRSQKLDGRMSADVSHCSRSRTGSPKHARMSTRQGRGGGDSEE